MPLLDRSTLKPPSLSLASNQCSTTVPGALVHADRCCGARAGLRPVAVRNAATVSAVLFIDRTLSAELSGSVSYATPIGCPLNVDVGLEKRATRGTPWHAYAMIERKPVPSWTQRR